MYDRYGIKGLKEGNGGGGGGFSSDDLFSQLFGGGLFGGGGMGPKANRQRRGADTVHPLKVTLEDLYNGKTSKLQLFKNVICAACNGNGGKSGACKPCDGCRGTGMKVQYRQVLPGVTQQVQSRCLKCHGEGEILKDSDRCPTCAGKKVCNQTKILDVHVDKGMKEGQRILFRGEGDQEPNAEPGDVVIILSQKSHERFKRTGDDLVVMHAITLTEALCGFQFVLKHLDDRELLISHPAGQIVKPGDIKGIVGEGMPMYKNPFEKGNLYIKFTVTFPENHFQSEQVLAELEKILPPRPKVDIPIGDNVEEVDLHECDGNLDNSSGDQGRGEAYHSDGEDEDGARGTPMQCAQQ